MFKLIKEKHSKYPNSMSSSKVLFKTKKLKINIQEFYNPHYLEFSIWKRSGEFGFLALKKWKKLPLTIKDRKRVKAIKCMGNIDVIRKERSNQ